MNRLIKSAALPLCAMLGAVPAQAQTYVGASAGVSLPEDARNSGEFASNVAATTLFPAITGGTALSWRTEYKADISLGLQIGHRFENGLRVEAELNYAKAGIARHRAMTIGTANVDATDSRILTRATGTGTAPTVGTVLNSETGKEESYGGFANVFYDLNHGGRFMPYIGAGAGIQRVELDYRPSGIDLGQARKTNFAWQVMGGASFKVTDRFEVFGQYSYRDNGDVRLGVDVVPARITHDSRQSIVVAGIRVAVDK